MPRPNPAPARRSGTRRPGRGAVPAIRAPSCSLCPSVPTPAREGARPAGPAPIVWGGGEGSREGRWVLGTPRPEARPPLPGTPSPGLWTLPDKLAVNSSTATHNIMGENQGQDETEGDRRGEAGSAGAGFRQPGAGRGQTKPQTLCRDWGGPLKPERGAAQLSCAHRGPAPGSVGGSVTASCGRGRADAHTPYSCQFPCWDPSRACFLHEGVGSGWGGSADLQSRASTGRRARSPGWRQRARAASLQPPQTPPATSLPCSLLCPESGSPENGVGGPLLQVPAAKRKGQAGLCRKAERGPA